MPARSTAYYYSLLIRHANLTAIRTACPLLSFRQPDFLILRTPIPQHTF